LSYDDKESGGPLKSQGKATQRYGGSWPDSKVQHRINDHRHHFLKTIALKLFDKLQDKEMDRFVLAGPRGGEGKSVSRLKGHLHSYVEERTIGSFEGEPESPDSDLVEELRVVIKNYEKTDEKKFLKHLLNEARRSDGMGVLGLEETLRVLRNAQVKTLVVRSDSKRSGWICPEDYYLSATRTNCPECEGDLKVTEDILGHMIWEAVDQRSEVRMIKTDPEDEFSKNDVGALLRFRQ
jgi:peptide subunit release factor 1 (eRF1)